MTPTQIIIIALFIESLTCTIPYLPIHITSKITNGVNGFNGTAPLFGYQTAILPDLDGDGIDELVVATKGVIVNDDTYSPIYILWMNEDGSVKKWVSVEVEENGFGAAVEVIDDLDGDGINELLVGGARYAGERGAVWFIWINVDGEVKDHTRISSLHGWDISFSSGWLFGASLTLIDDLDKDGIHEIAVGAPGYNFAFGSVWILFIDSNATVKNYTAFSGSAILGGLGWSMTLIDDLDDDGIKELVVTHSEIFLPQIFVCFLNRNGTVKDFRTIRPDNTTSPYGYSVSMISDLDGDGIHELAITSANDEENPYFIGALWIVKLDRNASVVASVKPSRNFTSEDIDIEGEVFGVSVGTLSNVDARYPAPLLVTSANVSSGGQGTLWILEFEFDLFTSTVGISTNEHNPQDLFTSSIYQISTTEHTSQDALATTLETVSTSSVTEECTVLVSCIETKLYCICPLCSDLLCTKSRDPYIVISEEDVSIFSQIDITFLSLNKTELSVNFNTEIRISENLIILDSNLKVYITSEEKETLESGTILDIISVDGTIEGSFNEVNIFVDGELDDSVKLIQEGNHFSLQAPKKSYLWLILLIIIFVFIIVAIILFTNRKFRNNFLLTDRLSLETYPVVE